MDNSLTSVKVYVESDDKMIKSEKNNFLNSSDASDSINTDLNGNMDENMDVDEADPDPLAVVQQNVNDDRICKVLISSGSTNVYSVLKTSFCSVQYSKEKSPEDSEAHYSQAPTQGRIGSGRNRVEFFYEDPRSPLFPPVYVETSSQVSAVAVYVAEKAEEFKRRFGGGMEGHQQFHTSAVVARNTVEEEVLKHVRACFTKKGMKQFKVGREKRSYPKRSEIFKVKREKLDENESFCESDAIKSDMPELDSVYVAEELPDIDIPEMPKMESIASNNNVKNKKKKSTVVSKPRQLSQELSSLLEVAPDETLTRLQIVTRLWKYLTEHDLQDPKNKLWFTPDQRMAPIFGENKIKCFGMDDYLEGHII